MQILAISKANEGVTPEKMKPYFSEEIKHTVENYLDGRIRNFWFKSGKLGVVFMLESADEVEARQVLGELPLVAAGMIDFEVIPLQPLKPLGSLIGHNFLP